MEKQLIKITTWSKREIRIELFGQGYYVLKDRVSDFIKDHASDIASEVLQNLQRHEVVKIPVEMLAFMNGEIREVEVPKTEWDAAEDKTDRLELVFKYGQNDFQPQEMCSVSMGDVIVMGNSRYRVAMFGFEEVSMEEVK